MTGGLSRRLGWGTGALAAGVVVGLFAPGAFGAKRAPRVPLQIQSTSLAQQGRQLVWQLQIAQPFSPAGLARDRRTLCLELGPIRPAGTTAQLCIVGPARGSTTPRLLYSPISRGGVMAPARALAATITRASDSELTAAFLPGDVGIGYTRVRWEVVSAVDQSPCAAGGRCSTAVGTRPALLTLHTPRLVGCVPSGPSWVFHGPRQAREIALTFDDGPWYDTLQFLRLLEREHVVATFFQIGDQIADYGEHGVDRRMLADGDMIGDHTWNYGGDVVAGGSGAEAQIDEAAAAIRKATGGFQPCLFRAPGGSVTPALLRKARSLGFATIQWDVDPRDWTTPGTAAIYDNVIANAHDSAIVIQHDGGGDRSETLAALPVEIAALRHRGYRFVTLTEMLGYRLLYR